MSRRILPFLTLFTLTFTLCACASRAQSPASEPPVAPPPPVATQESNESPIPSPEERIEPLIETEAEHPEPLESPPPSQQFDPSAVSVEVKTAAISDIRSLIDELNEIIQRKDYTAWLRHLTADYVSYYSDPILLALYSEYPILKQQGIHLETLKDYFLFLVYPSRQNDRVDDIEYVSENLVKAITVSPQGNRDILYILEKHGDTWHIGIGRH